VSGLCSYLFALDLCKSNWDDNAASPQWICSVESIHFIVKCVLYYMLYECHGASDKELN